MKAVAPEITAVVSAARLRYVSDQRPGITRHFRGKHPTYYGPDGSKVTDAEQLRRIASLAIPPAWTEVWICPHADGHIQAVGRDARGRKQYRYHQRWREVRDETKFERILAFGTRLPKIRRRVTAHLKRRGVSREKVLAAVVRLLETTLIRVGNDEYAAQNGSYGLTTLRNRHAKVHGGQITFEFKGKSGIRHRIDVRDPIVAKIVRKCQDLPGQELFAYVDDEGAVHDVTSNDVNAYLRECAGEEFSAKDFRTWAGTVLAAIALGEFEQFVSQREAKQNIVRAVEAVAQVLGNTAAVCRKCYIHPAILESYIDGRTIQTLSDSADQMLDRSLRQLRPEEAAVLGFLRERLKEVSSTGAKPRKASDLRSASTAKSKKR